MKNTTMKLISASMLAALACIATMVIKIPSPLHGYINLGDCIVLLAGWMLSPVYAFMAAALGSALADLLSGYFIYVPATFLVKGIMALTAYALYGMLHQRNGKLSARIFSGTAAEILMVTGYYIFEGFLYGFGAAVVNIPANAVQGIAGLTLGVILGKLFEKGKLRPFTADSEGKTHG